MRIPLTNEKKAALLQNLYLCMTAEVPSSNLVCSCDDCKNYWRPEISIDKYLERLNAIDGVATMTSKLATNIDERSYIQIALDRQKFDKIKRLGTKTIKKALMESSPNEVEVMLQLGGEPDKPRSLYPWKTGIPMIDDPESYTAVDRIFLFYTNDALSDNHHDRFFQKTVKLFTKL